MVINLTTNDKIKLMLKIGIFMYIFNSFNAKRLKDIKLKLQ